MLQETITILTTLIKPFLRKFWNYRARAICWWNYIRRCRLGREEGLPFRCNICGRMTAAPVVDLQQREKPTCWHCLSTQRFRAVIYALTTGLFGRPLSIADIPTQGKNFVGIGMSDSEVYADRLAEKLNYTNTFYHQQPHLDITHLTREQLGSYDFVITSDVFEHVLPPIDKAFANLRRLLKPRGCCILSVPYHPQGVTKELHPEINEDYRLEKQGQSWILFYTKTDGQIVSTDQVEFHGGPGTTLVMRHYARPDLEQTLKNTGFSQVIFLESDSPEFGILWGSYRCYPIILKKT